MDQSTPDVRRAALDARHSPWRHANLAGLFEETALACPERPILIMADLAVSYADMRDRARRLASGLAGRGIGAGDHVALVLANGPALIAAKLAIAWLGAVAVPLNFNLRRDELAYVVGQSDARLLIAMDGFRGRDYLADLAAIVPAELDIVVEERAGIGHAWTQLSYLLSHSPVDAAPPADAHAISDIIYTSGTTALPKGVMLTHDMVLRTGFACARVRAFEEGRRLGFAAPMYHVHGYVECLVACLFVGGAVVPQDRFDAAGLLDLAERHQVSEISGVPTLTEQLLETARVRGFDAQALTCVFNTGGANREDIWQEIRDVLQPREVVTAYGMTETTASTTCTLPEGDDVWLRLGNGCLKEAGAAAPANLPFLARYKVIDPVSGADLPMGAIGELVVTGASVTSGYYRKPEETAAAFTVDGWLRTGDLGRIDSDGNLTLAGRIKETYRCGGETVMPREIEAVLEEHAGVSTAFVVGVPDPRMGEVGCACIVAAGAPPAANDLIAWCSTRLARFKVPRFILFVVESELPLTSTGRVRKFALAEMARTRLSPDPS